MWLVLLAGLVIVDNVRLRVLEARLKSGLRKTRKEHESLCNFIVEKDEEILSEFVFNYTEFGKHLLDNLQETSDLIKEANEIG